MLETIKELAEPYVAYASTHLLRPFLVMITALLLFNLPTLIYKTRLTIQGLAYLLFCNDKKWTKPEDPAKVFDPILSSPNGDKSVKRKTIIFVRHGESTWNDTFNKGSHRSAAVFAIGFIPGLIKATLYELYLLLSGKMDSWFYDSPLSHLGLGQVDELAVFLSEKPSKLTAREAELVSILRGDAGAPPSRILCSSLRRALSTMAAGFRDRLSRRPNEKILILPALQEIARNPDTLSITPAHSTVTPSWIDKSSKVCDFQGIFTKQIDVSLHGGNKPINTNGLKRMNKFCDYVFSDQVAEDVIIVGGHSIWFRSFFRTYLPYSSDHVSKKNKVVNAGCVAFSLMTAKTSDGDRYMVDPQKIEVIYGGF